MKFENTKVYNFEGAIRGMRNPMNSWDKSDSRYIADGIYVIGNNDMTLMQKLIKAGSEHRKFMRQIIISVDIAAPLYWWKEFDTYKVGTVANSCSTMHKIHEKEFILDDFSHEKLNIISLNIIEELIKVLNANRRMFLETNDKQYWWQIIQLLPSSYNQKRMVTLNYENVLSMFSQRKNHKLDEWSIDFVKWVEALHYSKELITGNEVS